MSLPCILPLLRCIDDLIKMAQSCNVMIQDFIGDVKLCQCELHCFYIDLHTSFQSSQFSDFQEIVSGQSHIVSYEWMMDLETHVEYLSFRIGEHTYPTHWYDEMLCQQSIA